MDPKIGSLCFDHPSKPIFCVAVTNHSAAAPLTAGVGHTWPELGRKRMWSSQDLNPAGQYLGPRHYNSRVVSCHALCLVCPRERGKAFFSQIPAIRQSNCRTNPLTRQFVQCFWHFYCFYSGSLSNSLSLIVFFFSQHGWRQFPRNSICVPTQHR